MDTKARPILFSGAMVEAIMDGRKTQTRRVIRPQPKDDLSWAKHGERSASTFYASEYAMRGDLMRCCRYGQRGDRLWVRETWQGQNGDGLWWHEVKPDWRELNNWAWTNPVRPAFDEVPPRWLPSIHMPRRVSRLTLEVVDVRVERVMKISENDARAEGVIIKDGWNPIIDFADLWNSINLKRGFGWPENPWVWVVEFKVI